MDENMHNAYLSPTDAKSTSKVWHRSRRPPQRRLHSRTGKEDMSRAAELQEIRTRITKLADPVGVLADIASGKPLAVRDWEGEIIDWDRPTVSDRRDAAKTLLDRISPALKAVDVTANEGAGLTFIVDSPVPLPNSQSKRMAIDGEQVIEHVQRQITAAIVEESNDEAEN